MKFFEECRVCKPPKRHVGCHATCADYIRNKKVLNERNDIIYEAKQQEYLNSRYSKKLGLK